LRHTAIDRIFNDRATLEAASREPIAPPHLLDKE